MTDDWMSWHKKTDTKISDEINLWQLQPPDDIECVMHK